MFALTWPVIPTTRANPRRIVVLIVGGSLRWRRTVTPWRVVRGAGGI
jgi:hypothetical protein